MLDHLRQQVVDTLAQATQVILATHGIAELQTTVLSCESIGLRLYLLVPQTSEHLTNIEDDPKCVVATNNWHLRGIAHCVQMSEHPNLALTHAPDAEWSALVEIYPTQLQIAGREGSGHAATIDIY